MATPQAAVPTSAPAPAPNSNRTLLIVIAILLALIVVGVVVGIVVASGGDDAADSDKSDGAVVETTVATVAETTPESITETVLEPTVAESVVPETTRANRDPALLPAGLYCRDLAAQGYSFSAAVTYWRTEGQPDRMDSDRNGIPCETVYSYDDIAAIFPYASAPVSEPLYMRLPSGLLCRDLRDRGVSVRDALDYFIYEGFPDRMDADGNGVPCETVYSDASRIWWNEY